MNDEQKAWRLWQLLQEVSDALWDCNEQAFMDFCIRENEENSYIKAPTAETEDDLPY